MKKVTSLILALVISISFVSCGATSDNDGTPKDNSNSVSAWEQLTDKEKEFYEKKDDEGFTIQKDTGYVYCDAKGYEDDYGWTYGDEGIVIAYWFGTDEIVHIPDEIDGKEVVNVANLPLYRYGDTNDEYHNLGRTFNVKEAYFPEKFGNVHCAFGKSLEKIELPKTQTEIAHGGFKSTNIKSFECPEELITIQDDAFLRCSSLESVTFNDKLETIGEAAFSYCDKLTTISLPNSVIQIDKYAFNGCKSLEEIKLPKNLKTISEDMFGHCESLKKLDIPDSVVEIGEAAFFCCGTIDIYIPSSVITIKEDAFKNCDKVTIHGTSGSYAEKYAKENGIEFIAE